jgi:hypothetical protein
MLSRVIEAREQYAARFAEAVVQEIWTEMGRRRVKSLRALALETGMTHQYLTARLKKDPKTGKPVTINVRDLAALGTVLAVEPAELLGRAREAVGPPPDRVDVLYAEYAAADLSPTEPAANRRAARKTGRKGSLSEDRG